MPLRLLIHGIVQGVGYRDAMCREAARLEISGWVRNRRDRTVEAVIAGEAQAIEAMLAWARRGPPAARVDRVDSESIEGAFSGFEWRPTV